MTKKNQPTESANQSLDQSMANRGLMNRFKKILDSDWMDEWTANAMSELLDEWHNTYKERALKKLDEEIARLQEMRKLALEDMSRESD